MLYTVTVLANVIPKMLHLNVNDLNFEGDETQKFIEMTNILSGKIRFNWNSQHANFTVVPSQGTLCPKQKLTCLVTHIAHLPGPISTDIELDLGDKMFQVVNVTAECDDEKNFLPKPSVCLKNMPLNVVTVHKVLLRNPGNRSKLYTISNPHPIPGIYVFPERGVLPGKSISVLYISAKMTACVQFSCAVHVEIPQTHSQQLLIRGNVEYPLVKLTPKRLQLKHISSTSSESARFAIENKSKNVVDVSIDLSSYDDFFVSESRYWWDPAFDTNFSLDVGASKQLHLHFMPIDTSGSTFFLPIKLNDILGPSVIKDKTTLQIDHFLDTHIPGAVPAVVHENLPHIEVQMYAGEPKLRILRRRVVFCEFYEAKDVEFREMKIVNCQKGADEFCVRTDDLRSPFELLYDEKFTRHENSLTRWLDHAEEIKLKASFAPKSRGEYRCILPVFLRSDQSTKPHSFICLQGLYPDPSIRVEQNVIHLRPVPLNVSTAERIVLNLKYHSTTCKLWSDVKLAELKVCFKEREEMSETETQVAMHVSFASSEKIALDTKLRVCCTCNNVVCEISLTCVAENCCLTTYEYLFHSQGTSRETLGVHRVSTYDKSVIIIFLLCPSVVSLKCLEFSLRKFNK